MSARKRSTDGSVTGWILYLVGTHFEVAVGPKGILFELSRMSKCSGVLARYAGDLAALARCAGYRAAGRHGVTPQIECVYLGRARRKMGYYFYCAEYGRVCSTQAT